MAVKIRQSGAWVDVSAPIPDVIPTGVIVMWSGTIASVPTGWALCNGSNGTPDLRERFIVGAGGDNPTVAGTSGYNPSDAGGANSVQLQLTEIPAHNHGVSDPGHSHQLYASSATDGGSGSGWRWESNNNTRGAAVGGTNIGGSGTGISIQNNGGGQSHENRPPYYALAFIMKT